MNLFDPVGPPLHECRLCASIKDAIEQKIPEDIKISSIVRTRKLCFLLHNSDTVPMTVCVSSSLLEELGSFKAAHKIQIGK